MDKTLYNNNNNNLTTIFFIHLDDKRDLFIVNKKTRYLRTSMIYDCSCECKWKNSNCDIINTRIYLNYILRVY